MSLEKSKIKKKEFTILVVDDDDLIIDEDVNLLKDQGYTVISTLNGKDTAKIVREQNVDVILLDYFMPGFTGEQVVEEIRAFNKDVVIVLQTGYSGKKPPLEMLESLDIQGYHDKSDGADKLLLWVASAVRSSGQIRANKRMREGLSIILNSIPQIFRDQAFTKLLSEILNEFTNLVHYINGYIIVEDSENSNTFVYGTGRFESISFEKFMQDTVRLDLINCAKKEKDLVFADNILILPMLDDDNWLGMIYVEYSDFVNDETFDLIKIYASQAVEAVVNMRLHEQVKIANERLKDSFGNLRKTYFELIDVLTKAVDARDRYTAGHSNRVSLYARVIGKALGLSKDEMAKLKIASLFHDIGKIGIPDFVLLKSGKLSDEEFTFIKEHPTIGSKILAPVETLEEVIPAVKHHHEKYDGSGYPNGVIGEEIPLNARILAIADSFDAMTSDRTYKPRKDYEEALKELERCAGTHFDPELAKIFTEQVRNRLGYFRRLISFWDHYNKIDESTWSYTDPFGFVHYGYCFENLSEAK